jgi:long-chain acyl-CoA synthetase
MNLGTTLRESAARTPHKPAVICGDQVITYEAFDRSTDALARWLLRQDVEPGDRVALHWCNSIDAATLYFGCFKAGLIAVPVNNRLKPAEIAYILGHSRAKLCFSQPHMSPLCEEIRGECADLRQLYTSLPDLDAPELANGRLAQVSPEKVAAILYTSGTTARPKGVTHTHISLTGCVELMSTLGVDETDVLLAMTQMLHISGLACVLLPAIARCATVVLMPAFDPAQSLDLIERWRVTMLLSLPAMLRLVLEEQARQPRDVGSVRMCLAGGDTVPVNLQERFRALFGCSVREIFAMTETVPITCIPEDSPRSGSVGPVVGVIDARVMTLTGKPAADGEIGELQIQSPANCIGYWENQQATDDTFDDGWLRTGDLVRRDADGYFWFEGRVKQIIVRCGSNISPQEVEEALYHHPAVLEAGVIGMPDPTVGEKVVAFVALREGRTANEQELRDLVRSRLADYKTPEHIIFLDVLPKGLTGKIQRRDLKDLALQSPQWGLAAHT